VATDLPPELSELAADQSGVLSRGQILDAGLSAALVNSRLNRGSWRRIYPGVYSTSSAHPTRTASLWAAVLYSGPGAALSHQTAAELWKLADEPSSLIHVTIPVGRRVRKRPGIMLHLSVRASAAVHPSRNPPQTRLEDTVIDLWQTARSLDTAVGWLTSAIGRRLTTQRKLRETMAARGRVRWRSQLTELLSPDAAGIHSVLEYRYVRDVERPHGLAGADRQVCVRRNGRNTYRDMLYEKYQTVVELDGRVAHPGDSRWNDIRRDNAAITDGLSTLRYGWRDVTLTACMAAAEVAAVLTDRGYAGAYPCSADCPVGRSAQKPTHMRARSRPRVAARRRARSAQRA
jgi:hypothetical protein